MTEICRTTLHDASAGVPHRMSVQLPRLEFIFGAFVEHVGLIEHPSRGFFDSLGIA